MVLDLVAIGDTFLDVFIGPLSRISLTGDIKAQIKTRVFEVSEAQIFAGRVSGRRANLASGFRMDGGGSAANTALAGSKLGMKCGTVIKVGNDDRGCFCINELRRLGIDTSRARIDKKEGTGVSVCLLNRIGKRSTVTYLGANANLSIEDIDFSYLSKTKAIHIANCYYLPKLLGKPLRELTKRIKGTSKEILISLDPGPIPITYTSKQINSITTSLEFVDFFLPTIDEVRTITKLQSPKQASLDILKRGPKVVITKMGKKGCLVTSKEEVKEISAREVNEIVDTAGAGDVFAATLVLYLIEELPVSQAAFFANVSASLKLRGRGREGYPTRKEVEDACKRFSQGSAR